MYNKINGDLISLAKEGKFDVIVHGCNCFCTMGAGLAPQMAKNFGADRFYLENSNYKGNINKLGQISYGTTYIKDGEIPRIYLTPKDNLTLTNNGFKKLEVVNAYTQYNPGKDLDYNALILCLKKINHMFKGKHIGLPKIGAGIA